MKRTKLYWSVGIFVMFTILFGGLSIAQKSPKDKFEFPPLHEIKMPKVEQKTLKNGLRLFLVEDHEYPTIAMRAMIRTGSIYEPADKIGLAAIAGAVLRTGGTETMTGDEIDKILETMAATIESGIGTNSGYLTVSMLKEDIDKVLPILADILMHPAFRDDKIELAKIQQRTAISRRNDDIGQITNREFNKLIYGADSPYARHSEYTTIEAISRDDIVAFYQKFIHPNNMIMAVWGDFKSKNMFKKLKKTFVSWKSAAIDIPPTPKVNYEYKFTVNYIDKPDVNQSNIMMGHIGGLRNNPDYPALTIMNRILSFDRMFKKIRTDEGLAYSVWGYYGAGYDHLGVFSAGAQTKSQSTVRAIELMLKEMNRITQEEVTAEELKRAKDQYLNSFVFNFDSKAKIVNRMMTYAYFGYPLDFSEKIKQGVEKVTKADILRVAKKYLQPDKVRILVVGKKEDFDKPLSSLGKVNVIDITIPQPKAEAVPVATKESLIKGKNFFEKAMAALGDVEKIKNIKNYSAKIDLVQVTPMGEMKMEAEGTIEFPNKARYSMTTPGGKMLMVINGNQGWMKHPGGTMPMPDVQKKAILASLFRDPFNVINNLNTLKIQYIGEKDFADTKTIELLISDTENTFHLYLNSETYLPIGSSYQGMTQTGPAQKQELFSDYRDVQGLKVAFKTETTANGKKESESVIKEIKFNLPLEENYFSVE